MDMMDAALGSLSLASSGQMMQYSMTMAKKAMDTETASAARMLEMLPDGNAFSVRGPQPGDVPAVAKGEFVDVYA